MHRARLLVAEVLTARQTHASVEYLRTHAGLGQDSRPAKQYRLQLHVTTNDPSSATPAHGTHRSQPRRGDRAQALGVRSARLSDFIVSSFPPSPRTAQKIQDNAHNARQDHNQTCNSKRTFGRVPAPPRHNSEGEPQKHHLDYDEQARNYPQRCMDFSAYSEKSADEHNHQTQDAWSANHQRRNYEILCHGLFVC
jgi:hypothetical protein